MRLFIERIKNLVNNKRRALSIDGKDIKSATDKNNKSNEITAIPELLNLIDILELLFIIDTIGAQTNIANKIINKK